MASTIAAIQKPEQRSRLKSAGAAFFWLSGFYLVYCARPEDWIPSLSILPLAKITGILAFLTFLFASRKSNRRFQDLPAESYLLLAMIGVLVISAFHSPVWRGGAVSHTLDFAKVYIAWVLTFLLVTDLAKFRRIIFIQVGSVALISIVSIIKGRATGRLDGVLGGIYSNPNDLAFAIVLSLPFCLMFLLISPGKFRKILWAVAIVVSSLALFRTASRGGFITLVVTSTVCLWHFGVKGKRFFLLVSSALTIFILLLVAGNSLRSRFIVMWNEDPENHEQRVAYASYEERRFLMERAIQGIMEYPVLGIGAQNFEEYSTQWREVHMTYFQIAVEGGIPSLILYMLFFGRGFLNLRKLRKRKDAAPELKLFAGALHSSLIGFVVGALFSPEAYQFFPYFAVAYTSVLLAYMREQDRAMIALQEKPAVASRAVVRPRRIPVHP